MPNREALELLLSEIGEQWLEARAGNDRNEMQKIEARLRAAEKQLEESEESHA